MSDVVCGMSHILSLVHIRLVLNLAINLLVLVTSWTCTISIAAQAGQWKQATLTYGIRSRQGPKGQITWPKWSEINGSAKIGRHKWSDKKLVDRTHESGVRGVVRNMKFTVRSLGGFLNKCLWLVISIDQYKTNQSSWCSLSPLYTDGPNFHVTPGNPKPHHSFTCLANQLCLWLWDIKKGLSSQVN